MWGPEWQKQVQRWVSNWCPWMRYCPKKLTNYQHWNTSPCCKTWPDQPPSPWHLLSEKSLADLFLINCLTPLPPYLNSYLHSLFCASLFCFLSVAGIQIKLHLFIIKDPFITRLLGKFWQLVFIPLTSTFWGWIGCGLSGTLKTNLLAASELLWIVSRLCFRTQVWFWDR